MAATDARPVPQKNTLYRVYFPLFDASGLPLTSATGLDSERSLDGAAFADCTNEAILVGSNVFYLELTAAEMNTDSTVVQVKNAAGTALATLPIYPEDSGDIRTNTTQIEGSDPTDQINAACDVAISDAALATAANLATVDTIVDAIKLVTDALPDNGALTALLADITSILADTNELQTDNVPGLIAALNNLSAAQVNSEVSDVLKTDTIAELSQAQPPTTPTFETAVMLLYMALRNTLTVSDTSKQIRNDAGTVITKKALSDDGSTFTETKMVTGP